jgi:glutamate synthase domain-containing protein 3
MTGGRALILGRTGRNFAAGMSGGIAFVYDPDGTFAIRCNKGNVDIKPLHEKSLPEIRRMLERHLEYTGSPVARRMLDNWETEIARFVRVMPRDFAAVLRKQEEAARAKELQHAAK